MKKTTCKRILGLFILIFAFFIIGIVNVYAESCSECTKISGGLSKRYPITINRNGTQYTLIFGSLDKSIVEANPKFKLVRVEKYDSSKVDANGNVATGDKTVFNVDGGVITAYISGGKTTKNSIVIDTNSIPGFADVKTDTINFIFEPNGGYIDPAYKKCRGEGKPCGENGNITYVETSLTIEDFGGPITGGVGKTPVKPGDPTYTSTNCGNQVKAFDDTGKKPSNFNASVALAEIDAIYPDKSVFDYKFCYAKIKAIETNNIENFTPKDSSKDHLTYSDKYDKPKTFKCDYNVFIPNDTKLASYYNDSKNTKYLYGMSEYTKTFGSYTYHYPTKTEEEPISCKLKCEESVIVEYGAPIASSAGLCFGYKVRVTSRVNCGAAEMPNAPTGEYKYCIPSPTCKKEGGNAHDQGGPSESFDECIKACDGGKYTSECSNKCYKSVYGSSTKSMANTGNAQVEKLTSLTKLADDKELCTHSYKYAVANNQRDAENKYYTKIPGWDITSNACTDTNKANCISYFDDGYYIMNGKIYWDLGAATGVDRNSDNKTSRWRCSDGKPVYNESGPGFWYKNLNSANYWSYFPFEARWYVAHAKEWGFDHEYNYYTDTGIPTTGTCKETCSWGGCSADSYFSEDTAKREKEKNEALYNKAVKECSAAASCSTTTSTYAIKVDYKTVGASTETTIYFPYTKDNDGKMKKDTHNDITYQGEKGANCVTSPNPKNSVVIDQDGSCYTCSGRCPVKDGQCDASKAGGKCSNDCDRLWYRTEWTFPGVWFNQKRRSEIRYDEPIGEEGQFYDHVDKMFCLPQRIVSTNSSWYYLYQSKIIKLDQYKNTSINQGVDDCEYDYIKNPDPVKASDIKYNITADTREFGMFGWNIQMKCFYATPSGSGGDKEVPKTCKKGDERASTKIRVVDLKNLFPDEDGNKPNTGTSANSIENNSKTVEHFNWSQYANQITKDPEYASQPLKYKNWVEEMNYKIYSDDYLDYEIYLTKSKISKIKNEKVTYTDWNGKVINNNENRSHSVYMSSFLRDNFCGKDGTSKCPDTSVLKCNNIENYNSKKCQEF